jgi:hypothetical protein
VELTRLTPSAGESRGLFSLAPSSAWARGNIRSETHTILVTGIKRPFSLVFNRSRQRRRLVAAQPEPLAEELQHGCFGRDLPGATQECWNAGGRIDAQGMEDRGGELA